MFSSFVVKLHNTQLSDDHDGSVQDVFLRDDHDASLHDACRQR